MLFSDSPPSASYSSCRSISLNLHLLRHYTYLPTACLHNCQSVCFRIFVFQFLAWFPSVCLFPVCLRLNLPVHSPASPPANLSVCLTDSCPACVPIPTSPSMPYCSLTDCIPARFPIRRFVSLICKYSLPTCMRICADIYLSVYR